MRRSFIDCFLTTHECLLVLRRAINYLGAIKFASKNTFRLVKKFGMKQEVERLDVVWLTF